MFEGFNDKIDELGRTYIIILFISAVIWAFIAINNVETPRVFKLSLIYSLLLIFGFIGVMMDRSRKGFGLDSRIWESKKLNYALLISVLFIFGWYMAFMRSGFSIASAQSVGASFSVSPTLNFLLIGVLGPLAEDIFFFGVLNITFILLIKQFIADKGRGLVVAGLMFATYPIFSNVPGSFYVIGSAAGLTAITAASKNKFLLKNAPFVIAALFIGGAVFPKFHSYAYQLDERHYIAAIVFGILVSLLIGYVGLLPVDIVHIANNIVATG